MMLRPPVLNRRRFLGLAALGSTALSLFRHALAQHLDGALTATFDADWWWGAFRALTLKALAAVRLQRVWPAGLQPALRDSGPA